MYLVTVFEVFGRGSGTFDKPHAHRRAPHLRPADGVHRCEERRHRGLRVAALAPRAREQRRETAEPSRDGGSSHSSRPAVGWAPGGVLSPSPPSSGNRGGARGELGRRTRCGSLQGIHGDTCRGASSRGGDRRHGAAAGRGAHPVFTSVTGCERDKVIRAPRREVKAGWCATGVESVCALSPEATGGMVGPANGLRQQQRAAATVAGG
jgi:hypothetical protein